MEEASEGRANSAIERLRDNIRRCFYGNAEAVSRVIVCLLARGHVLIEDVPGVGKTTLAVALAKSIDGSLARLQMTPDMLPADILGVTVWDRKREDFEFKPGPIFHNLILADEVNRTTPRTQSALLEAMSEGQVSIDGITHKLLDPFMVIATQNPFEFEGTYFLPESQLDRFLMRISLGYPSAEDEARVLVNDPRRTALKEMAPVVTTTELKAMQEDAGGRRGGPAPGGVRRLAGGRDACQRPLPDRRFAPRGALRCCGRPRPRRTSPVATTWCPRTSPSTRWRSSPTAASRATRTSTRRAEPRSG